MEYAINGLPLSSEYSSSCSVNNLKIFSSEALYYFDLDDTEIKSLLQYGPVVVGVDNSEWIKTYTGGVFECSTDGGLNYLALLVGYD